MPQSLEEVKCHKSPFLCESQQVSSSDSHESGPECMKRKNCDHNWPDCLHSQNMSTTIKDGLHNRIVNTAGANGTPAFTFKNHSNLSKDFSALLLKACQNFLTSASWLLFSLAFSMISEYSWHDHEYETKKFNGPHTPSRVSRNAVVSTVKRASSFSPLETSLSGWLRRPNFELWLYIPWIAF